MATTEFPIHSCFADLLHTPGGKKNKKNIVDGSVYVYSQTYICIHMYMCMHIKYFATRTLFCTQIRSISHPSLVQLLVLP